MRINRVGKGAWCIQRATAIPVCALLVVVTSLAAARASAAQYACGSYIAPPTFPPQLAYTFDNVNVYPSPGGICAAATQTWQRQFPANQFFSYLVGEGSNANCRIETTQTGYFTSFGTLEFLKGLCPEGYRLQNGFVCGPINPAQPPSACPTDGRPDPFANLGRPEACDIAGPNPILVGNPINTRTGNKYQEETDYRGAGAFPLAFVRHYNSYPVARPSLGPGWRHHYDRHIVVEDANHVAVIRPSGQAFEFALTNGAWTSASNRTDRLQRTGTGWILLTASDEIETYSEAGLLLEIADRAGRVQSLRYSDSSTPLAIAPEPGLLLSVTDPAGRSLRFTYDAFSRIASMTDPAGQMYWYGYRGSSNRGAVGPLSSVMYPGPIPEPVRRYSYAHFDAANPKLTYALTGITDENGATFAAYAYDDAGRAIRSSHGGESLGADPHTLTYAADGTTDVDDSKVSRTFGFRTIQGIARVESVTQPCASCGSAIARSEFDEAGFVRSRLNFKGIATAYERLDPGARRDLITAVTEAVDTLVERRIGTEWDARFRLPTRIVEPGREVVQVWDERANPSRRAIQDTASGQSRAWDYTNTYSAPILGRYLKGSLTQVRIGGPRIDQHSTLDYYGPDEICAPGATDRSTIGCRGQLSRLTNALGHETRITRYNAHGQPEEIVDPNGLITTLTYDARQRLSARSTGTETTRYAYDPAGQLVRVTLPDASFVDYAYDDAHRLIRVQDSLSNRAEYILDAQGNRIREDSFDPDGKLAATRSREFDELNRLSRDIGGTDPTAQFTRYEYDPQGNLVVIDDPLGRTTTREFDALDRLVAIVDSAQGRTQLGYDALDQLTHVQDPLGLATTFGRNALGDLEIQRSPDTGASSHTYDEAGNLLSHTDARGVITTYSYDALNRVTSARFDPPAGSGLVAITHTYAYDQGANGIGRLTRIGDPAGSTAYTYDAHGRIIQDTRAIAGVTYSTGYRYDEFGRLDRLTYPSGRTLDYSYDAAGRVQQIDTTYAGLTQALVGGVRYHPLADVSSFLYGNATLHRRTFDLDGRIESHTLGASTRALHYDAASRITRFSHPDPALDQHFGYDSLDRLTHWLASNTSQSYAYDANGNRISATYGISTYAYGYAPASNRLASVAGPTPLRYGYDPAGNPTADGVRGFVHDARGRLVQVTRGATTVIYGINALGQRVSKSGSGAGTRYHYDVAGRLIAETAADGRTLKEYAWLGDLPVGLLDADADADAVADVDDNCLAVANASQLDADLDGYGNACDADLNNDAFVNSLDVGLQQQAFGKRAGQSGFNPAADLNGDGIVNALDLGLFRTLFGLPPGPSGRRGQASAPALYAVHADHLNTPRALADGSSRTVWRWSQADPFGANLPEEDPDGDGKRVTMNLRFPGQYFDRETGLHYNYFRDYDPQTGRYLQSDPIGLRGGINTYAYVRGNPLRHSDRLGLQGVATVPEVVVLGGLACYLTPGCKKLLDQLAKSCGYSLDRFQDWLLNSSDSEKPNTLQPGPHASDSIPARGPERDFTPEERDAINDIGRTTGCHTCGSTDPGTKSGNFVPDHQPPNALNPAGSPQGLYPHCIGCSRTQGGQIRGGRSPTGGGE